MKAKAIVFILFLGVLTSCRQRHVKTIHLTVPDMQNHACVLVVSNALKQVPGLLRTRTTFDVPGRTVAVTYDSLALARKNIEFAIAEAGFSTEEVVTTSRGTVTNRIPADPEAVKKLPAECRP